jgi:sugar phosphate isomerase/epimerase
MMMGDELKRRVLWAATVRNKTLAQRLEAARIGRFTHMTLFPIDVRRWEAEALTAREVRAMMQDSGIELLAMDPYGQWVPDFAFPSDYPDLLKSHFDFDEAEIFRMSETLEALEINLVEPFRGPWKRSYELPALVDAFGAFADRARDRGFVTTLEFMPLSFISDLELAWKIVSGANRPDTGICYDTWHFARSGSSLDLLASIPGEKIAEIQISDARAELAGDLITDLLHHRLLPGEGELNVAEQVRVLRQIGAYRSVGPEIFADRFDEMDHMTAGRLAGESLDQWSADELREVV